MKKFRNTFLLALTSIVWGLSFVSQSTGGDAIGPFAFNSIRSIMGGVVLLPVIKFLDSRGNERKPETDEQKRTLRKVGILCGTVLFVATSLQQVGMYYGTPSGQAGFITAFYILIVPIISLFAGTKKRPGWNVWIAVAMAICGLYLICIKGETSVQLSDILILLCAFGFATHITIVDKYSPLVDGVRLACMQFFVSGFLGLLPGLFLDTGMFTGGFGAWLQVFATWDVWKALLYSGVMSCGVGYTLQIIGQDGMNPTVASLIMSFESVFAVLAGWLLLGETLTASETTGCVIMFAAICLAQIRSS